MAVRRAVFDDVPGIARVHVASWEGVYRGLIPDSIFERVTIAASQATLTRYFANPPDSTALLVAEEPSGIVGMAWIGPNRDDDIEDDNVGEVFAIYVDPENWDEGHGKALMIGALDEMRSSGFATATLWVLDTNQRGRSFYERGGWVADGAVKLDESFGDPLREVRYRVEL